jgi:hypothetical protein
MPFTLSQQSVSAFRTLGFLVLRRFFEPGPLADEIDRVIADGSRGTARWGDMTFRYVPMMTSRTPASLALLDRSESVAAALLGGPVLPTRAKCVQYVGDTPWHVDSEVPLASVGVLAYLEPRRSDTGALRVIPRSHHPELGDTVRARGPAAVGLEAPVDVPTEPGDVVLMHEHLWHGSVGGTVRRQWRVDFLPDPQDAETEVRVKAYFARLFAPDWRAEYDVERYPSYGADWKRSNRPAVARLAALGVYQLADTQEAPSRAATSFGPKRGDGIRPRRS